MKDFSVYSMGQLIDHVQAAGFVGAMRAAEAKYGRKSPLAICPLDAPREDHAAAAARSHHMVDKVPPELRR